MSAPDNPDDGWDDGPDDGSDDAIGTGVDSAVAGGGPGGPSSLGEPDPAGRKRRRRRRRRRDHAGDPAAAPTIPNQADAPTRVEVAAETPQQVDGADPAGNPRDEHARNDRGRDDRGGQQAGQRGGRDDRGGQQAGQRGGRDDRGGQQAAQQPGQAGQRGGRDDRGGQRGGQEARNDRAGQRDGQGGQQARDDRGGQRGGQGGQQARDDRAGQRDGQGGQQTRDDRAGQRGGRDARSGGQRGGQEARDERGGGGREARGGQEARDERGGGGRDARGGQAGQRGGRDDRGGRDARGGQGGQRGGRGRDGGNDRDRFRDQRGRENRLDPGAEADLRDESDDILRGDPYRDAPEDRSAPSPALGAATTARGSQPGVQVHAHDDEDHAPEPPEAHEKWGSDDGQPAQPITLASDLPADPPADDPDPTTHHLVDGPSAQLGDDVASVVGVRYVPAGRIQWCDAGESDFVPGERVMVDSERGQRLAWIATPPTRRQVRDRSLRRVIRRANEVDLRGELAGEHDRVELLRIAKDKAAALRLPLKVFRVEKSGNKLNVYYTSDERLDLRDFVRDVGQATNLRLELRQLGTRDEAKMVGGIGSCGLTLCCTTWLPDFVPVSIKMAKDQGLVLSPTKVSGQCGRLKCCLVYEQAGYAEMRKGLPKLGKRVISAKGEGRVVEVDVLRQRVRVSYGPGDTEVLPATEVKPMFPSGNQPARGGGSHHHEHDADEPDTPDEPDLPTS